MREYIAHRANRERQILAALGGGPKRAMEIVQIVYAAYPAALHAAAAQSVIQHLRKLLRERSVTRDDSGSDLDARWTSA